MKKSIKTLAFTLLTVGMLAGCNKPAPDWSKEQKDLMDQYAYGIYVPYLDKSDLVVHYDEEEEVLLIDGAKVEGTELKDYNAKFKQEDGWTKVTSDYIDPEDYPAGSFTAYSKGIATEAGNRYIDVLVFATAEVTDPETGEVELTYATEGDLTIEFLDVYDYDLSGLFPGLFEYYEAVEWDVPVPETSVGCFYVSEDPNNALYYYFGMESYMNVQILGYHIPQSEYDAFNAKFANWTKTTVQGATQANLNIAGKGYASVMYQYSASEETLAYVVYFWLDLERLSAWPAAQLSAGFVASEATEFEVPAFTGANLQFTFRDYPGQGAEIGVLGATEAEVAAYLDTTLPGAGWTVTKGDDQGSAKQTFETETLNGVAKISYYDEDDGFYLDIFYELDPIPGTYWPADAIAAAFAELGLTPFEVPAPAQEGLAFEYKFNEENKDKINDPASCKDTVKVTGFTADGLTAYLADLEAAGWEPEVDRWGDIDFYKHFETEGFTAHIYVEQYYFSYYGYVNVTIYYIVDKDPVAVWPAAEIAAILGASVTDVLPAYTGENATFKPYNDAYGMGVTVFVGEGNEETAMEAYAATLTGAGFTLSETTGYFYSANSQFLVYLYKGTGGAFNIEIAFPANIPAILAQIGGEGFTAPDFSSLSDKVDDVNTYVKNSYTAQIRFVGDCVDAVLAILTAAGWIVPETPSTQYGYECYSDSTHTYEMDVKLNTTYGYTNIYFYNWTE